MSDVDNGPENGPEGMQEHAEVWCRLVAQQFVVKSAWTSSSGGSESDLGSRTCTRQQTHVEDVSLTCMFRTVLSRSTLLSIGGLSKHNLQQNTPACAAL